MAEVLYGSKPRKYGEYFRGAWRAACCRESVWKGGVIRVSRWMGGKAGRQPGTGEATVEIEDGHSERYFGEVAERRRGAGWKDVCRRFWRLVLGGGGKPGSGGCAGGTAAAWPLRKGTLRRRLFRNQGCRLVSALDGFNSRRGAAHSNAQRRCLSPSTERTAVMVNDIGVRSANLHRSFALAAASVSDVAGLLVACVSTANPCTTIVIVSSIGAHLFLAGGAHSATPCIVEESLTKKHG
jgi:hypothetical protein